MAAMSVMGATLMNSSMVPLSEKTGATSTSNPNAGQDKNEDPTATFKPVTTGDKAGAAILTILVCIGMAASMVWITLE